MVRLRFRQLVAAADLLRPRTLFRTLARVGQLADTSRDLQSMVKSLNTRTMQLESMARLDWEQRDACERLAQVLDRRRIRRHIERAFDQAPIHHEPFPYAVVHDWLPRDVYDALNCAVPPPVFFAAKEERRQQLAVPFEFAPAYSRAVWTFTANEIVGEMLVQSLTTKFAECLRVHALRAFGHADDGVTTSLHISDGRILLRRPGYVIPPHRDPKWAFITGLAYLAREGDSEQFGTQLYRVDGDENAPDDKPWYVDPSRCELVRSVPFRANSLLVFLNTTGAHGASIPADAQPPTLERYVYQFRLGPDTRTITTLLRRMTAEQRRQWGGHKARRAIGEAGLDDGHTPNGHDRSTALSSSDAG